MNATDFEPLFVAVGRDMVYYTRSLGVRDSETGFPAVTWNNAGTVRVIMYKLSNRNEGTPDTRGVTEQRYYAICQSAVAKDSRLVFGSDYYLIDTEPSPLVMDDAVIAYECEALREFLKT